MKKLLNEISSFNEFLTNKTLQKIFKDEMVQKTWKYQKKYGFETNPRKGHDFWDVEADAFKHTFGSAKLQHRYGKIGSLLSGIGHEWQTTNNPPDEWNMDSWNNNQGRIIADEIDREYGNKFYSFSEEQQDDIIAEKVMKKMRNNELITHPSDTRPYTNFPEKAIGDFKNFLDKTLEKTKPDKQGHLYTPKEIGKMSIDDFSQNRPLIMQQMKEGKISNKPKTVNYSGYTNPIDGSNKVFTREYIKAMPIDEYSKNEDIIKAQLANIGIPSNSELEFASSSGGGVIYIKPYTKQDGTYVRGHYRSV